MSGPSPPPRSKGCRTRDVKKNLSFPFPLRCPDFNSVPIFFIYSFNNKKFCWKEEHYEDSVNENLFEDLVVTRVQRRVYLSLPTHRNKEGERSDLPGFLIRSDSDTSLRGTSVYY